MRGGLGCRKFYFNEVDRIESKWAKDFPAGTGYTDEQIRAGYKAVADKFGFFRTLSFVQKETKTSRNELLNWTVYEFKYQLSYLAWENETERKYYEIKNPKK